MTLQQRYPNGYPWFVGSQLPIVKMTICRSVWTQDDLEVGETNDHNVETYDATLREMIDALRECLECSQVPIQNGHTWASGSCEDPHTGDLHETRVHLTRLDGKPLKVYQLLRLYKLARIKAS